MPVLWTLFMFCFLFCFVFLFFFVEELVCEVAFGMIPLYIFAHNSCVQCIRRAILCLGGRRAADGKGTGSILWRLFGSGFSSLLFSSFCQL